MTGIDAGALEEFTRGAVGLVVTAAASRRVKVEGDLFHGRVPDGAVYVGRAAPGLPASPYCNPFSVTRYGLAESRRRFRTHLAARPELLAQARHDLPRHDLACWCPLDAAWCHADDLLRLAAGRTLQELSEGGRARRPPPARGEDIDMSFDARQGGIDKSTSSASVNTVLAGAGTDPAKVVHIDIDSDTLPAPTPRPVPTAGLFEVAVLVDGQWSTVGWTPLRGDADLLAEAFITHRSTRVAQIWQGGRVIAEHRRPQPR